MAIGDQTYPWTRRTLGTYLYKNLYSHSFGYTETRKMVSAASAAAAHASIASATSAQTVTTGFINPDVPRAIAVVVGGTASSVEDSSVVVTGTNVEGKTITETFITTGGATGTINGTKAFKTVTQIFIPAQRGTAATFMVGTLNKLGLNHRLFKNNTTVKVYTSTVAYGALTLQGAPTVVANEDQIELNVVTPLTVPDGTLIFTILYTFDNWSLAPINDEPEYSTTTSTSSTSSSTSTTTITTSTSSTSISTSSTSISTSSTSTSTSSTSTSTTTLP